MAGHPEGEPLIDVLARFELEEDQSFGTWLKYGTDRGWVSKVYCETHEGAPTYRWEELEYDEHGEPPCIPSVRVLRLTHDTNTDEVPE